MKYSDDKYEFYGPENENGFRRIRALRSFGEVKEGEVGGYIQSEDNLSQSGTCWVYDDAQVYGKAYVKEDAQVRDCAKVHGVNRCEISGEAVIGHAAHLEDTFATDMAHIMGESHVIESNIEGRALLKENCNVMASHVTGQSVIGGYGAVVNSVLRGETIVTDNAMLNKCNCSDEVSVSGLSHVHFCNMEGRVQIDGRNQIHECDFYGDIQIEGENEFTSKQFKGECHYRDGINLTERHRQADDLTSGIDFDDRECQSLPSDVLF